MWNLTNLKAPINEFHVHILQFTGEQVRSLYTKFTFYLILNLGFIFSSTTMQKCVCVLLFSYPHICILVKTYCRLYLLQIDQWNHHENCKIAQMITMNCDPTLLLLLKNCNSYLPAEDFTTKLWVGVCVRGLSHEIFVYAWNFVFIGQNHISLYSKIVLHMYLCIATIADDSCKQVDTCWVAYTATHKFDMYIH